MSRKKTYVLDTNVYLTDFNSIHSFKNNDIVVPFKVLEEVDKHKKRQDAVGSNARRIIRIFDELRTRGSLQNGVRLGKGKGILYVRGYESSLLPEEFRPSDPDNQIIATALTEQQRSPRKVILVSRDINMRVKCDSLGLLTEDYNVGKIVQTASELFTGTTSHLVDDEVIDRFYEGGDVILDEQDVTLFANQFVMLVSNSNEKKTALARFYDYDSPLKRMNGDWRDGIWGVIPRNKEQQFAFEVLMDPKIEVVSLIGKAGSGKTLCALAAGLEQLLKPGKRGEERKGIYSRLIVTRPVQPLGKDIGYLPGTMEEKMAPWLMPIQDNLQYLLGDDRTTLEMYMSDGTIEVEALTYIRGRSIANAFIIVDEAQNLTKHELKTIITRVGEGTKIILTGDIEQIDNMYIDETSNGLTYAVERFKKYDLSGHVTLQKGERSRVATLAAKIL
jgi:PhoH-like ATPase